MRTTFSRFDKGPFLKVHRYTRVYYTFLMDHIWMLLLLQRIFSEVPVLMLLYLILDNLYGCFSCFRGLFWKFWDSSYNLRFKLSFFKVFFQMVHKKKLFRRFSVKYRTVQKVQREVIYFPM